MSAPDDLDRRIGALAARQTLEADDYDRQGGPLALESRRITRDVHQMLALAGLVWPACRDLLLTRPDLTPAECLLAALAEIGAVLTEPAPVPKGAKP